MQLMAVVGSRLLGPYESYEGSPASKGILQFDMCGVTPSSGLCDWEALKEKIKQHGLRNSLLVAPMPTASTSQILGKVAVYSAIHYLGTCRLNC